MRRTVRCGKPADIICAAESFSPGDESRQVEKRVPEHGRGTKDVCKRCMAARRRRVTSESCARLYEHKKRDIVSGPGERFMPTTGSRRPSPSSIMGHGIDRRFPQPRPRQTRRANSFAQNRLPPLRKQPSEKTAAGKSGGPARSGRRSALQDDDDRDDAHRISRCR